MVKTSSPTPTSQYVPPPVYPSADGTPLGIGTGVFLLIWIGLGLIGTILAATGKVITKHEISLWWFLTALMTFCMWLMCKFLYSLRNPMLEFFS
jgi:hypothetical protein